MKHQSFRRKAIPSFAALLLLGVSSLPAATVLTGDYTFSPGGGEAGNVTVGGMLDVYGNVFDLGSAGTTANAGIIYTYTDSASSNSSVVITAYRNALIWRWQQNSSSGEKDKMVLDQNNALTLTAPNYTSGNAGKVVITPSTGGSTITMDGNALLTTATATSLYVSKSANQFAIGTAASATGTYSTALGFNAQAPGDYSTALGVATVAGGEGAIAIGAGVDQTFASYYAVAVGAYASAAGMNSVALGVGASASGDLSSALGNGSYARGYSATALGGGLDLANANGDYSMALGDATWATGIQSAALGCGAAAYGVDSVALGFNSFASGGFSTAIGGAVDGAFAYGAYSIAMGDLSYADNYASMALGMQSMANADYSTAIGPNTIASAAYSTVIGRYNVQQGNQYDWIATDDLFVVGNGSPQLDSNGNFVFDDNGNIIANRSNAFVVKKNGSATFSGPVHVPQSGDLSMGEFTTIPQ